MYKELILANNKNRDKMNNIVTRIKKEFNNVADLKIKVINLNLVNKIYIIYLETICDSNKINEYILKNLTHYNFKNNLNSNLPGGNTVLLSNEDEIEFYLTNGFAIIIKNKQLLAVEVKGNINRDVSTASREPSLVGSNDAFNENYQLNLGLIKRRIKTNTLKTEQMILGRKTKTIVSINYLEDVANLNNVKEIKKRLSKIDVDGIIDVGMIINYIDNQNKTVFPTLRRTERPDLASASLLEGKIVILVDTSPFAIILPTFLVDYLNPVTDNYLKNVNTTFIKLLRVFCFILSMITPGLFIAIINYNQETIPSSLLINFSMQRSGVPFPSIVELLILLLICDMLRESDLRFPSNFGSTISILGALIIGEAAVNAGIVSPIMIIITSLTFISSLIFTELEITSALRCYRYLFLFFAATFGLYGIFLCSMFFLINIISLKSLNSPYFAPLAPFNKTYFFNTILKRQKFNNKRSTLITNQNYTRGKIL